MITKKGLEMKLFPFFMGGLFIFSGFFSSCQNVENTSMQELFTKYYGTDNEQPGGTLLEMREGKTINKYSFGKADRENEIPNSPDISYRMASVSKHFTAFSIYQLIDEGKLNLETTITSVLEGMNEVYDEVTIGELLNHTSGIMDYEDLIPEDRKEQLSDADVFDLVKDEKETYFEPGTEFRYSNTGFCILTLVVEQVTHQSYPDYMREQVFEPQHIRARIYEAKNPPPKRAFGYHPLEGGKFRFADQSLTSATKGDGGVYITPREFAKWSRFLMTKLRAKDSYFSILEKNKYTVTKDVAYSMGWFLLNNSAGETVLAHSGETTGFHNIVVLNPHRRESITLFTNRDDNLIGPAFDAVLEASEGEWPSFKPSLFAFLSGIYAHREEK